MAEDFEQIGSFLSRWSRRKQESAAEESRAATPKSGKASGAPPEAASDSDPSPNAERNPAVEGDADHSDELPAELPPIESLTPESDFRQFMQPGVDPGLKSAALKQLFKDPRFNVTDVLDTYIEDYSLPDPIPEAMMKTLYQAREHLWTDEEKAIADAADAAELAAVEKRRQALDSADAPTAELSAKPGTDHHFAPESEPERASGATRAVNAPTEPKDA